MKKIISSLIIIMIIGMFSTISEAVDNSYEIHVTTNKEEVITNEKFDVTLTLDNINILTGQQGIGAYNAKIDYDNTDLEIVEIKGLGNWETPVENEGEIVATTKDGECVNTKQDIAVITFVAKTEAVNVVSPIKIINFEASDTENTTGTEDREVKININVKSEGTKPGNTQGNGDKNNNQQINQNEKKDNSIIKIPLPFTGRTVNINWVGILLILIIIAVILSIIIKAKKRESE